MARRPKGALVAWWDAREADIKFRWDKHKADGHLLHGALTAPRMALDSTKPGGVTYSAPSLADELKARGYDLTTLRFSIERRGVVEGEVK